MPKTQGTEHANQCAIIQWAKLHERRYPYLKLLYAIPNGAKLPYRKTRAGKRYSREAVRLKKEGMRPGVSDMHLPVPMGAYCGLWVELKVGYNKPTKEQKAWTDSMNDIGHYACTCWGDVEATEIIEQYLNLQPGETM